MAEERERMPGGRGIPHQAAQTASRQIIEMTLAGQLDQAASAGVAARMRDRLDGVRPNSLSICAIW